MGQRLKTTLPTTAGLPTQTTGCQRNKTHPGENEGEGKTMIQRALWQRVAINTHRQCYQNATWQQWKAATVLFKPLSRSYVVQAPDGIKYHRNKRHLHVMSAPATMSSEDTASLDK